MESKHLHMSPAPQKKCPNEFEKRSQQTLRFACNRKLENANIFLNEMICYPRAFNSSVFLLYVNNSLIFVQRMRINSSMKHKWELHQVFWAPKELTLHTHIVVVWVLWEVCSPVSRSSSYYRPPDSCMCGIISKLFPFPSPPATNLLPSSLLTSREMSSHCRLSEGKRLTLTTSPLS